MSQTRREGFVVRVRGVGLPGPVGVGFVVGERHILTCAHVVNTALGRDSRDQKAPGPEVRIRVDFPVLGDAEGGSLRCRVALWAPPPVSGTSGGDMAGLVLAGESLPAGAGPARLVQAGDVQGTEVAVFGFPGESPRDGAWAVCRLRGAVGGGMIQLDVAGEAGIRVQPGYSGSPVVVPDGAGDGVVGMLAAISRDGVVRDAYAIPVARLMDAWPEVLAASVQPHQASPDATQDSATASRPAPLSVMRTTGLRVDAPVTALALGEIDGRSIVLVGTEDATVYVLDLTTGLPIGTPLTGHGGPVWAVAFGYLVGRPVAISASDDHTVRVWDLATGSAIGEPFVGHSKAVNAVAFTDLDGRPVAISASDDHTVRVWDLATGSPIGEPFAGHNAWVNAVATVSVPGMSTVAVSGSTDQTVQIWEIATRHVLSTLTGHSDSVSSVAAAVLPSGRPVTVSGSLDETVRVWDISTGELIETLDGHSGGVRTVAIGVLEGRAVVVSGSNDGSLRVWDLELSPTLLLERTEHTGALRAVAVGARDGRSLIVSGGDDRAVQVWSPTGAPAPQDQVEWLSDTPARQDLLRRRPLAQALATRFRRIHAAEPGTSFLVHIDGAWGAGKSTLLNFLRAELDKDWVTVDFDAWRQSRVGPPWWALLAALRGGVVGNRNFLARTGLRMLESWSRLRRAGAPFILALTMLVIAASSVFLLLGPRTPTLQATGDLAKMVTAAVTALGTLWAGALVAGRFLLWDSAKGARLFEQSNTNPMQDVADHFGWLVTRARRPVVFFIDDLDRCTEGYVVELLDSIQTLIRDAGRDATHKSCQAVGVYFVVAADGVWIRKSYEIAYDKFVQSVAEPGRPLGYLFLDKLFQLRVPVPSIGGVRQRDYLQQLLRVRHVHLNSPTQAAEEQATREQLRQSSTEAEVVETLRRASPQIRERVAGSAVERLTAPEVEAATEHSLQRFGPLLTPNPRSMKRFVNAYSVLRAVRTLESNPIRTEPLALWSIIETRWPSLADYLRSKPDAVDLVGKPATELEIIPVDLRELFSDSAVSRLTNFEHGGPLTPELIRACCGAEPTRLDQSGSSTNQVPQ